MKIIWSGLESSGKSLQLARKVDELVYRNARYFIKNKKERPIYSNMIFSPKFEQFAKNMNVPILYWHDLAELIKIENADVLMDEVGNYFDARGWSELSLDVRRWLTQAAKCGVEIYGTAQDFAQVDIAFRRLVNELYHIRKIIGSGRPSATRPPIKRIWGICLVRELDPNGYDEKQFKVKSVIPGLFFIRRKYCDIFNTNQKIVRSKPAPYKHIEKECEDPTCDFHKTLHL